MGKVILCTGRRAVTPYVFKATGIRVFTIEELCYYIYHNIETISDELYSADLIAFIGEELGLTSRADELRLLAKKRVGIKDMVVYILCSADYYGKQEIQLLLHRIDTFCSMNPFQQRKYRADSCMQHGRFMEALQEYTEILADSNCNQLSEEDYGNILHNIGVLKAKSGSFGLAADSFMEAYKRNHQKESLKQYLCARKLSGENDIFEKEMRIYSGDTKMISEVLQCIASYNEKVQYSELYMEIESLIKEKKAGKAKEYQEHVDIVLEQLKYKYRNYCL